MLLATLLPRKMKKRKKKQKEGQCCYSGKREERKKMQLENIGIFVNKKNSSDSVFSPFWGETF